MHQMISHPKLTRCPRGCSRVILLNSSRFERTVRSS